MIKNESLRRNGNVAFIYPALQDKNGFNQPILNFTTKTKDVSVVMCAAFIDLDPDGDYMILMSMKSSSGNELLPFNTHSIIPKNDIHPAHKTTFLSAKIDFTIKESGCYMFECQLLEKPSYLIDSKVIKFNIFYDGE
ncbi:hypothetical protein LU604_10745 [Erwinia tracheiphila]|uniref:Uncharacterized protein n=1 Tax=Erwinia tracheiphila TaxID=65700 RepID=A0A345CRL9_9GAMM|nr:hypothetical protein [Erwinia tracheiphila]AXF76086.1 hypothetical protein AV903_08520 [Erwinia tracheiphila]UIA85255.1 hypothetical protein LU604_10745 [Erwinia tracheiphila]